MSMVSPCVGTCKLDEATGYCIGCARTGDEIALWGGETDAWRADIWDALPERFDRLGVACRRLPWDTDEIRAFVVRSLQENQGTWVAGVVGAVGEFTAAPGNSVDVGLEADIIVATTPGARLRFHINDDVHAVTFDPKKTPTRDMRVMLAVKRERGRPEVAQVLSPLGRDHAAIAATDRDAPLFDLGLGRKEARFCVRAGPGPLHDALARTAGTAFPANLPKIGPILLEASPARVIETAFGRIEVLTPIPAPTGKSPLGPHTHLLPDHLASGRATPAGMDLPRAYLPGAIFYPAA
ncbi:DUF1289 domain-containing protein [Roseibium sp. HPY-6]|uniref:DUF1289 domain-containing protein n=1 Tax=Roseibium sp. HPY-6 TaxID=3229852 RepID=UPI00338E78FA